MTVAYRLRADGGVLEFCGELDHHAARSAMLRAEQLLDTYQPGALFLDFSGLSFMDSSGIALLLKLQKRTQALGGTMCVENLPPQAWRVLVGAGIDRLIKLSKKRGNT